MKNSSFLCALVIAAAAGSGMAEVRNWTNSANQTIQAELLRIDEGSAVLQMNGKEYPVPVASLSKPDQDYIAEWQAMQEKAEAEATAEAEASRPELLSKLDGQLVILSGREIEPFQIEDESKLEYMAFYSSASWCGPCQAFSPTLVRKYKSLQRRYENFELALLSADNTEADWVEYLKDHKMPYPSVKFGSAAKGAASRGRKTNGIPSIHVIRLSDGAAVIDGSSGASNSLDQLEDLLKESSR